MLGAILLLALPVLWARAGSLTPAERRGREIFLRGTSIGGHRVSVTLNGEPAPVTFGCAGCHGRDGRGRAEGGIRPPDIRGETLVRPRLATGDARHPRPAYDRGTLKRALTMGIDAGGRRLDPVMPRYHLFREDAEDLLAFLGRLGGLSDPGLTADDFRVGVFLPAGLERGAARRAIEEWASDLRARGGIYARQPEVLFLENGATDLELLSEETEPLALVGDPGAGSIDQVAGWVNTREVPWLRETRNGATAGTSETWIIELAPSAERGPLALLTEVRSLEGALKRVGRDVSRERLVSVLRKN